MVLLMPFSMAENFSLGMDMGGFGMLVQQSLTVHTT